ncbi:MAG TPA: hypothetical protein VMU11_02430 [Verrucomicrobiae bacterium]|nr:hypothetical protein [Verrucomicrobiae bacterium]
MEVVTLKSADKPIAPEKKGKVVDFGEDMIKAIGLLDAKTKLEARIGELENLADLAPDKESRASLEAELKDLEENRVGIVQSLGELRPEDFGTEAAFEKALNDPESTLRKRAEENRKIIIESKEEEKDELEDASRKLKGRLRLLTAEHKQMVGKDMARAHELEAEMRETQTQLEEAEGKRLEAWKALADFDPETFGADAQLEFAAAAKSKKEIAAASEEEAEDVLAALHEQIEGE